MHEGEAECNLPHHVGRICLAERLVLLEILSKMSPLSASSTKAVVPGKTMKRVGQTNDMTVLPKQGEDFTLVFHLSSTRHGLEGQPISLNRTFARRSSRGHMAPDRVGTNFVPV